MQSGQFEEKVFLKELENNMRERVDQLAKHLSSIRTSRATPGILDTVMVNISNIDSATTTQIPIKHIANVAISGERTLVITVWDNKNIKSIEKAISESKLDLALTTDGNDIRAILPPLSGERRQSLMKLVSEQAEKSKVEIRNVRATAIRNIRDLKLSQDQAKRLEKQIQNHTDKYIGDVDKKITQKKSELQN